MFRRLRNWSWIRRVEPLIWNLVAYGLVAAVPAVWAVMTPFVPHGWSWPTAIAVFLGVIGLLLFVSNQLAVYLDRIRRQRRAVAVTLPEIDEGQVIPLMELAEWYDANMAKVIYHLPETAQTIPHLTVPDPYVDLEFGFINASVFDLTYHRVIGLVSYQGEPFQRTLMHPGQAVSATAFVQILIRHGARSGFTLRQWVSHAAAQRIIAEIQHTGIVVPDTRPIAVCFTYTNHLGEQKEACVGIPGLPYEIKQVG